MRRLFVPAALLAAVVLTPGLAHARGGYSGKSGTVMTPFGPAYNTGSPEWKQSGGNIFVYQQLMEQKLMMQQQQMMMKQQQMMMKQQQKKGNTPAANASSPPVTLPHKKKKRRTYVPTHTVPSPVTRPAADLKPETAVKDGSAKTPTPPSP